jgi:tetratricopeptide (TPR) repeat protein
MAKRAIGFVLLGLCLATTGLPTGFAWGQAGAVQDETKPIGKLITAAGDVSIEHTSAVVLQASAPPSGKGQARAGDLVFQGDVVQTGANGIVAIMFADGTSFNISSNARMELNELIYDPKGNSNSTLFSLKKGTFTFLAGAIAKTGNMKVETPVGTMGIRGTAPRVEIAEDGSVKFSTLIEENKKQQASGSGSPQQRSQSSSTTSFAAAGENETLKELELCNGADRTPADTRILACSALIELRVDNPQALATVYNNRAIARASKGDLDGAIQDYDQSIKFDPAYDKAFNNRGLAYQKKGDLDQAIKDFDTAITISPEYTGALGNRAQTYEKKRDYTLALKDLDAAILRQPTSGNFHNERCWLRAITGSPREALADCNDAIRLGPASAAKFDSRGFTFLKLEQWPAAIADFESALLLNPRFASSLYGRGFAKLKTGDVAGGNADMAAAVRLQRTVAAEFAQYGLR